MALSSSLILEDTSKVVALGTSCSGTVFISDCILVSVTGGKVCEVLDDVYSGAFFDRI